MDMRITALCLTVAFTAISYAETSIPATRNGYSFVDVTDVDVSGLIYPVRDSLDNGTARVLRAEDAACLAEAVCERDAWLNGTNAPTQTKWYQPSPTRVLVSNLVYSANEFFTTQGRDIPGRLLLSGGADPIRRYISTEWVCSLQTMTGYDTGFNRYFDEGGTNFRWGIGCLNEYLNPTASNIQQGFDGILSCANMERLYKDVQATKRLFGGFVYGYSTQSEWTKDYAGMITTDQGTYTLHRYDSPADSSGNYTTLYEETKSGWAFYRGCWTRMAPPESMGGRSSPYSWTTTSSAPYVIMRQDYTGKIESAELYLSVRVERITAYVQGESERTEILMGVLRVPLTSGGTTTFLGGTCEKWMMPSAMTSSTILDGFIGGVFSTQGLNGGFPTINSCMVYSGVLDLVMKPSIDIDVEDWP